MFPYVTKQLFELRIQYTPEDFDLSDEADAGEDSEWDLVVDSILEEESARVEGEEYANDSWRGENDSVPPTVRSAVIALTQYELSQVKERGLDRESLGSGASGSGGTYDYTSDEEFHNSVKRNLADAGVGDEFWSVTL